MKKIFYIIMAFPLTLITVAAIWYLSFFTPPSTKLDNVVGFDKIVHFGMYAFLETLALLERNIYNTKDNIIINRNYLAISILFVIMSGVIEILQETCTSGRRSGDIFDFIANSLGVILAALIVKKLF